MKKLLTIFLTLALVLTAAACGKDDGSKKSGKLSGDDAALLLSSHYYLKCSAPLADGVVGTLEYAANGLKEASTSAANDSLAWALREDDTIYLMNSADKSYTTMKLSEYTAQSSHDSLLPDFSGLSYSGTTGDETLGDVKYAYEEYTYNGGMLRFYYEGETLAKIGMGASPSDFVMDIITLSGDLPASLFDRSGYASADPVSSSPAPSAPSGSEAPAPSSSKPAASAPSSSKPAASAPSSSKPAASAGVPGEVDLSGLLGGSASADENVQGQVTVVG